MITNCIQLDFNKENDLKVPSVQYDSGSRFVKIKLQRNKSPFKIDGYRVTVVANKVDGTEIMNDCTILDGVNGVVQFEITEQFNAVEGVVDCQLKLFKGKTLLTSMPFSINVVKSVSTKEIVSSNELKTLVNALGEVQNIDNRLSQKANANEVVKKGYGTLNDFDEETRRAIQGMSGTEINAVLGKENVTTYNLANGSVTLDKCEFNPVTGKVNSNLIQIDNLKFGYYIRYTSGVEVVNSEYSVTDYITICSDCEYILSHRDQLVFYDEDKNYISGLDNGGDDSIHKPFVFTTPSNAKYIRISIKRVYNYIVQLELGDNLPLYQRGGTILERHKLEDSVINDLSSIDEKLEYEVSDNLFDKSKVISGCYIRWNTGEIVEKDGYCVSDFITIKEEQHYVINYYEQVTFFDSCKHYIGGLDGSELLNHVILTPKRAKYIRVTVKSSQIDYYQLELGKSITSYKPYKRKLKNIDKQEIINGIARDSKNLFNPNEILKGYYIQWTSGVLKENSSFIASDYIEIEQHTNYAINYFHQVAFYDENKLYISGVDGYNVSNQTVLSPDRAKYIRVTVASDKLNVYQLEKGHTVTDYETYGQKATDDFINSILINPNVGYKSVRSVFKKLANSLITGEKVAIKLIGDSITHGVGGTGWAQTGETIYGNFKVNENGYCWANLFKSYMESKFNCEVINYGTTGRNSKDLLNNINTIVKDTDDIVICMIGTNDRNNESRDGVLNSKTGLYQNLLNIHNNISTRGKEIIFMSNIPSSVANENDDKLFHMEDVDHIVSCVASSLNCEYISVYKLFMEYCQTRNITIDSLLADGLHPNDTGYDVMFYLICNALGFGTQRDGANWN